MNKKVSIAWPIIIAVVTVILGVALFNVSQENEKRRAIIDVACKHGTSQSQCEAAMEILMGMDPADIKKYGMGF